MKPMRKAVTLLVVGALLGGLIVYLLMPTPSGVVVPTQQASHDPDRVSRRSSPPPVVRPFHLPPPRLDVRDAAPAKTAVKAPDLSCLGEVSKRCPFRDPSPEVLRERARCGTISFDLPILNANAYPVADAEKDLVEGVLASYGSEALAELRRVAQTLFVPLPDGIDLAGGLESVEKILNPVDSEEAARTLAKEHAGILPPKSATSGGPVERYWRFKIGLGDRFERALAAQLGAQRARELRNARDGWPSRGIMVGRCMDP
jgi:hypothetical protein